MKRKREEKVWVLYILISQDQRKTYCGITNRFCRRFRQHLGLIKGGARTTRQKGKDVHAFSWTPVCTVAGWESAKHVRQVEYRLHHPHQKKWGFSKWKNNQVYLYPELKHLLVSRGGIEYRLFALLFFLEKALDTSSNLHMTWYQPEFQKEIWKKSAVRQDISDLSRFLPILEELKSRSRACLPSPQ